MNAPVFSEEERSRLWIGASGYMYDDWVGSFYPRGLSRQDFLKFYATRFPVVEINATYYRIPPARSFQTMSQKTPREFLFIVKAHQDMTHKSSRETSLYRTFLESIRPLQDAGKLEGVLLQFPFGFRNDTRNRAHLAFLRETLPGMRVWVEFRHDSWDQPPVRDYLRRLSLGYCAVDEPSLPGLLPPSSLATSDTGYVRFHGRNAATWWGGGHERYDWEYTAEELSEWLEHLRDLASKTNRTYVFFNNCYMGRAIKSARILKRLLGMDDELELEF